MTKPAASARRHLDARLSKLRPLTTEPRPHRGWIKAIREALGMSTTELAARMNVSQSRIPALEKGEAGGSINLGSLQRAADALDCDLVYVLVPRRSLTDAVRAQARRKAAERLAGISHHMRLEDQSIDQDEQEAQLDELTDHFVDRRGLWAQPDLP